MELAAVSLRSLAQISLGGIDCKKVAPLCHWDNPFANLHLMKESPILSSSLLKIVHVQEALAITYFPDNQGIPIRYFPFTGGNYQTPLGIQASLKYK
jgi:hypothetical protein